MKYTIDNKEYDVIIIRKANKNTYIRFKNGNINITTSYFVSDKRIKKLLDDNNEFLKNSICKMNRKKEREENYFFLGEKYDIIIIDGIEEFDIASKKIYTSSKELLPKMIKKETEKLFNERLLHNYHLFEEKIPYPKLTIRKMSTRWGVCNRQEKKVTLNSELIKYGVEEIDYVIIHELSHFLAFNHSAEFWAYVAKYCHNYKEIRKKLKE